jgi:cobalt-zinc-cadmium efflux system membrane fusion protein
MKFKQIALKVGFASLVALALSSCGKGPVDNKAKEQAIETKPQIEHCISDTLGKMMTTDIVRTETIEDELKLSGEVAFDQDKVVRVLPLTSGVVMEVKVSLGDFVQAGQVLATMKSVEILGGYNDLATAQASLDAAEKTLTNTEVRYKSGLASEHDYSLAKNEADKARNNFEKARELLTVYGTGNTGKSGLITIKAPASGYIVEKKINAGTQVRTDNSDNLFTISGLQDVWILANVYENDISRIKEGYEAKVTTLAYPDKVFVGKIVKMGQVIDPDDKALKVRVLINNKDHLLKPEMFTAVTISNNAGIKALTIPASAPIMDYGHIYVIVLTDNCHYSAREIHPIKTVGTRTYLKDGLNEGEKVVTKEQLLLYNALKEI